jgi:transcriptional regulator with PAS, ATPase and Fis domain
MESSVMQKLLCAALSTPTKEDALNLEAFAQCVAPLGVDVLLRGETGTGKDTLAEKIHRMSGRSGKFVAINCAAIPESLAESQLFGANTGAFTGASQNRAGFVEAAHNGTLYLDEIDSMPLGLQAKLLRVLESRTVQRLGSTQNIPVDMRVIASAQSPLAEMVERGEFRRDLYFRLNIISLKLPPLRSRKERIVPLFQSLVRRAVAPVARLRLAGEHPRVAIGRQALRARLAGIAPRRAAGAQQLDSQAQRAPAAVRKDPHRGLHASPPSLHR